MAGTTKILNEISNTRKEISNIVDLLYKKRHIKIDITDIIEEKPLEVAVFAVLLGMLTALFSGKIKNLLKLALLTYATKQSISYLLKK